MLQLLHDRHKKDKEVIYASTMVLIYETLKLMLQMVRFRFEPVRTSWFSSVHGSASVMSVQVQVQAEDIPNRTEPNFGNTIRDATPWLISDM